VAKVPDAVLMGDFTDEELMQQVERVKSLRDSIGEEAAVSIITAAAVQLVYEKFVREGTTKEDARQAWANMFDELTAFSDLPEKKIN
jgi:hypothetical protein